MKFRAKVKEICVVTVLEFQPASFFEIVEEDSGVFLYRYDSKGTFAGDTWHATVEEAKKQAEFEYGILPDHWDVV